MVWHGYPTNKKSYNNEGNCQIEWSQIHDGFLPFYLEYWGAQPMAEPPSEIIGGARAPTDPSD